MTYHTDKLVYLGISILILIVMYFKYLRKKDYMKLYSLPEPPKYEDIVNEINKNQLITEKIEFRIGLFIKKLLVIELFFKLNIYLINYATKKSEDLQKLIFYYTSSINNVVKVIVISKKAEIKRTFFLFIFVLMIYFLFFSVLPGNERVLTFVYAVDDCGVPGMGDGDIGTTECTAYGGCNSGPAWQIGGEVDANACCGDDIATIGSTANYVITETANTDAPWPYDGTTGTACCSTGSDCVESGTNICTTEGSVAGSPPNAAKCWANNWYGGDNSETSCDDIVGVGYWDLGGDISNCCGDDNNEFSITETSSTDDAPDDYNDGITACCNPSTDCNYNYDCTAIGGASAPAVPNKAYCGASNTWYGGDNSSTACNAIGEDWIAGGTGTNSPCCGDDTNDDDWCDGTSYNACVDGTYETDADTYSAVCECGFAGPQGTCDDGEEGCWDNSEAACCGDDGASDDWCDGTSYNACVNGNYRADADADAAVCECGEAGTQGECDTNAETGCWDPTTSDCCGDDPGENFCAGAFTACYNANFRNNGDYNSYVCTCGNGFWDIGGEAVSSPNDLCCGDDIGNEYKRTQEVPSTNTMDNGYNDESGDDACCLANTDCVNESVCYNTGSSTSASVDQDSDTDYCLNGEWYDCQDNSDCPGSLLCALTTHDCVDADGYILIKNIGTTGIEITNHEYTSLRSVILELNYSDYAEDCRYGNGNLDEEPTIWTPWESCIGNRVWLLTESSGEKFVYYQINYSNPGRVPTFNDSIIYNYTGVGLDETDPFPPIIVLDDYINNNEYVPISWYNASDPESEVLGIPLRYYWVVFNNTDTLTSGTTTATSVNADISSYNFPNNTTLNVTVTVINSAGRTASDGPESTTIDLDFPYIIFLNGNFYNLTSGDYQSFPINEDTYVAASTVNFTWSGYDDITIDVNAYSYILTQNPDTPVDNIPEGSIGSFGTETYKKYTNLNPGKYYFKVKSRDLADNWGTVNSINFSIDSTAPSKPIIKDESRTGGNITITWYASSDPETNVANYNVSLFDSNEDEYNSTIVSGGVTEHTFENVPSGTYTGKVKAKNGVGLWSIWSDEEETVSDNEAPIITATPDGTTNLLVATSSP